VVVEEKEKEEGGETMSEPERDDGYGLVLAWSSPDATN